MPKKRRKLSKLPQLLLSLYRFDKKKLIIHILHILAVRKDAYYIAMFGEPVRKFFHKEFLCLIMLGYFLHSLR